MSLVRFHVVFTIFLLSAFSAGLAQPVWPSDPIQRSENYGRALCMSDPAFQLGLQAIRSILPSDSRLSEPRALLESWIPVHKKICETDAQLQYISAFSMVASRAIDCFFPDSSTPVNQCRLLLQLSREWIAQIPKQSTDSGHNKVGSALNQVSSNLAAKVEELKSSWSSMTKKRGRAKGITTKSLELEFSSLFSTLLSIQESWGTVVEKNIDIQLPLIETPLPPEQVLHLLATAKAIRDKNQSLAKQKLSEVFSFIQSQASLPTPKGAPGSYTESGISFPVLTQPLSLLHLSLLAEAYVAIEGQQWETAQTKLSQVLVWIKQNTTPVAPQTAQPTIGPAVTIPNPRPQSAPTLPQPNPAPQPVYSPSAPRPIPQPAPSVQPQTPPQVPYYPPHPRYPVPPPAPTYPQNGYPLSPGYSPAAPFDAPPQPTQPRPLPTQPAYPPQQPVYRPQPQPAYLPQQPIYTQPPYQPPAYPPQQPIYRPQPQPAYPPPQPAYPPPQAQPAPMRNDNPPSLTPQVQPMPQPPYPVPTPPYPPLHPPQPPSPPSYAAGYPAPMAYPAQQSTMYR